MIFKKRGDVVEKNSGFREIGDFANQLFESVQMPGLTGLKGTQLLHGRFPLFNSPHLSHARSLIEQRRQAVELSRKPTA